MRVQAVVTAWQTMQLSRVF